MDIIYDLTQHIDLFPFGCNTIVIGEYGGSQQGEIYISRRWTAKERVKKKVNKR